MAARRKTGPARPTRSRRVRSRTVDAGESPTVRTASDNSRAYSVLYVHGIGHQEPAEATKRNWDTALFGQAMGDQTRLAYWADVRDGGASADAAGTRSRARSRHARNEAEAERYEHAMQRAFEGRLRPVEAVGSYEGAVFGRFLPGVGDSIFKWLTERFVQDTSAYFHEPKTRQAIQDRFVKALEEAARPARPGDPAVPIILIAHSQGSIVAYDVLTELGSRTPSGRAIDVAAFVTIGSPLGIDEVQRKLAGAGAKLPYGRVPKAVRAWTNMADAFDPVALDKTLAGEFTTDEARPVHVHDVAVRNKVFWNPHSAVGYLSTEQVQSVVYSMLGWNRLSYGRRVRRDVLAEVVQVMAQREVSELRSGLQRHHVLIELRDVAGFGESARVGARGAEVRSLQENSARVVEYLKRSVEDVDEARIDPLKRFVAARLTAFEIQALESDRIADVYCVWKSTRKRALINRSAAVVQAPAAHLAYKAEGEGITWAVLDTGVQSNHPHFAKYGNVVQVWDCTQKGPVVPLAGTGAKAGAVSSDLEGHGTHVCGIIAGERPEPDGRASRRKKGAAGATLPFYRGLAPRARLHVYKVLDDGGFGEDAWIIKAIDHIAERNNAASDLSIHGVNLSLGGAFDPEVYGCGHSPICQELRRLWRQGLVVCVACGNEGVVELSTPDGPQMLNTFLSIGDPANLDECIAVGSVHSDNPHSYGISHFSSRGPTADGRAKPDLVAPGERIWSCNSHFAGDDEASLYISLDGTSMATPHVSGLVAAFLSVRREFIGRPDEVKRILLANCTDLARDRYLQGAGMPNLVKMLANT
jgi:hypothetical protein